MKSRRRIARFVETTYDFPAERIYMFYDERERLSPNNFHPGKEEKQIFSRPFTGKNKTRKPIRDGQRVVPRLFRDTPDIKKTDYGETVPFKKIYFYRFRMLMYNIFKQHKINKKMYSVRSFIFFTCQITPHFN